MRRRLCAGICVWRGCCDVRPWRFLFPSFALAAIWAQSALGSCPAGAMKDGR